MKWPYLIAIGLMLSVPIAWQWDTEPIPVNNGFGWDGNMYGMYTQFLPEAIDQGAINRFRMQRMLVPAALYHLMNRAGWERTQEQVIQAYRSSNMIFIGLAVIAFLWLARSSQWYWETMVLGFAALFFSMPLMKMSLLYPILADIPAMAIGLWAVLCWKKEWRIGLLVAILIGAFAGPTMWLYGLLLFSAGKNSDKADPPVGSFLWSLALPVLFVICWIWTWQTAPEVFTDPPSASQSVRFNLLPFAMILVLAYLTWVGQSLRLYNRVWVGLHRAQWIWLVPMALIYGLVQWVIQRYAGSEEVPQTLLSYGQLLLQQSVTYPLGFLAGHFAYMPGWVILGIFASPFLMKGLTRYGTGPLLFTLVTLLMVLGSETRQLMQVLPWLLFVFTDTVDRHYRFNPLLLGGILLGLWICAPWWQELTTQGSLDGSFLADPAQRYFRYHGPWMNLESWGNSLLALALVLGTFALSWRYGLIQTRGASGLS